MPLTDLWKVSPDAKALSALTLYNELKRAGALSADDDSGESLHVQPELESCPETEPEPISEPEIEPEPDKELSPLESPPSDDRSLHPTDIIRTSVDEQNDRSSPNSVRSSRSEDHHSSPVAEPFQMRKMRSEDIHRTDSAPAATTRRHGRLAATRARAGSAVPLISSMASELEKTKAELEAVRQQLSAITMERDELRLANAALTGSAQTEQEISSQ